MSTTAAAAATGAASATTASDQRVLDASQVVGPDALADILDFLGVDQDFFIQQVPGSAAEESRRIEGEA